MDKVIDYFFFTVSPWTYLGHRRLLEIARKHGATVRPRPMDSAAVFPVSGGLPLPQRSKQRQAYRLTELARWSKFLGLPMNIQPKHFPVPATPAALMIIAAEETSADAALALTGLVLAAAWEREQDVSDQNTLVALADEAGADGKALDKRSQAAEIGERYRSYTQQAIERQVFGAPTYIYRDELFWGQDRLDFLDRALAGSGQ